jgi:hypothetical protein
LTEPLPKKQEARPVEKSALPPKIAATAALLAVAPIVIDAQPVPRRGYVSPLEPGPGEERWPTVLRGGLVLDDVDRAGIAARLAYYRLPRWRRLFAPRPPSDRHLIARNHEMGE